MFNDVSISVNGQKYSGWTKVSIKKSLDTLSGFFDLIVVDMASPKLNENWPLKTQDNCVIRIGDDVIITGFIDSVKPTINSQNHTIQIRGREKTADLIDCSMTQSSKSFSKINFLNLAKTLADPFGITVKNATTINLTDTFKFTVNSSETVFEILDKKAKELGVLLITNSKGELVIANSGSLTATDSLILGENVLSCSAVYDFTNRFSDYKIQSQASSGGGDWGSSSGGKLSIAGASTDDEVTRFRPILIQGGGQLTNTKAKKRAQWEALIRAAKSQRVDTVVQGFRQSDDSLWKINELVSTLIPPLYINPATQLLISDVEYMLDENGSKVKMGLKRKDAYTANPVTKVKKQKGMGWG